MNDDPPFAWPPRIGSRVRSREGNEFVVVGAFRRADVGTVIVLQRKTEGGFQSRPVDERAWTREGFEMLP